MTSSYKIGSTFEEIVTLDTLIERDPQPMPVHYSEYITLGNGQARGVGWLETEWRWSRINTDEIAALRTLCTSGVSAAVYIETPDIDGDFMAYSAILEWPQAPAVLHGDYFQDFALRFVQLIEIQGT